MTLFGTVETSDLATTAQILLDSGVARGRLDVTDGSLIHEDEHNCDTTHFREAFCTFLATGTDGLTAEPSLTLFR